MKNKFNNMDNTQARILLHSQRSLLGNFHFLYALYEFESSRLTNEHVHPVMEGSLFGYNEKQSFGLLTFDTTLPDPTVTYQIYSIDDDLIYTLAVKRSEISYEK